MFDDDTANGRPRGSTLVAAMVALALLVPLAAPASGHAGATKITIEASEDCQDRTYCFEVTEGSVADIEAGSEINVTFVNPSDNTIDHNLHVAGLSAASQDRNTDASAAEANTATLAPGEQESFELFVPQSFEGAYLWCAVAGHESQGMYLEVPFGEQATTDSGEETNNSPAIGVLGLLAVAGAALAIRRER